MISSTPTSCRPNSSLPDQPIWQLNPDGEFTIQSAWNHWRSKFDKVVWHKLIWGPNSIPRVSFIVWMAIHERLNTGDRLQLFGLVPSSVCPFCQQSNENHSHLFFDCLFTAKIWHAIKTKCNVNWPDLKWPHIIPFATNETKRKSLRSTIIKLAMLCSVYLIWIERNNRIFNQELKPEEVIVKSIVQMVRGRLLSITSLPRSAGDEWFLSQWNLPATILKPHTLRMGGLLRDVSSLNEG